MVGARLRPGVQLGLGDASAVGAAGPAADAGTLTGPWGRRLGEQLAGTRTGREALAVLACCLEDLPVREQDPVVTGAVDVLLRDPRAGLSAAAAGAWLSDRQWRRRFVAQTGMGPKTLQRLLRFQLVLWQVQRGRADHSLPDSPLARIAADAGYFDQSHLVRECVRLTGRTPASFIEQTVACCGATHDHSAAFHLLRSR